ncbi:MAG: YceD family protein [Beijerinckiaceae bacterium]
MTARPALSRPVVVARLPRTGQHVRIVADAGQLEAIAAQLGLPKVETFEAEIEVAPASGKRYLAAGTVRARVRQTCVVTLEDFPADVEAPVEAVFADPEALPQPSRKEVERTLDDEDPPEPLENGAVDAGALAVEFLALALDPFPRKPGAALDGAEEENGAEKPFAALAALKGLKS